MGEAFLAKSVTKIKTGQGVVFTVVMCQSVTFSPESNISWCKQRELWRIEQAPGRLQVLVDPALLVEGWLLIRARLWRTGNDFSSVLLIETRHETLRVNLPISLKGNLYELVELPDGVQRLLIEPMGSAGHFMLEDLQFKRPGFAERRYTMLRRVLPLFSKLSKVERARLGFCWHSPLSDLQASYQTAGRLRASAASLQYWEWLLRFDALSPPERQRLKARGQALARTGPRYLLLINLVDVTQSEMLRQLRDSIAEQAYSAFDLVFVIRHKQQRGLLQAHFSGIVVLQENELPGYLDATRWPWVMLLRADSLLAPFALYWFAHELHNAPDAGMMYADHDHIDEQGERCDPYFKPDWSLEHARSSGFVGPVFALRMEVLVDYFKQYQPLDAYGVMLFAGRQLADYQIRHIPGLLHHQPLAAAKMGMLNRTLEQHLEDCDVDAKVTRDQHGWMHIRYACPKPAPLVSIIVPTRNRLELIRPCIESLLAKTHYQPFEIIIVDNHSDDAATLRYLETCAEHPQIRVLRYPWAFNYSAINNFAVEQANGAVICLLNNDTEVISSGWLTEMVGRLFQPQVGVVGAKLYFSDGRVQHAGDTVGPGGCASHLHGELMGEQGGYMERAHQAQEFSAVTAACLLTHRQLFQKLGGLDADNLVVAFNDVDYCLRVRENGYKVVFTPYAKLYHHESVSRGKDESPKKKRRAKQEADYMRKRWRKEMLHDPFYNPNLSYVRPDFSLSHAPRVERPW